MQCSVRVDHKPLDPSPRLRHTTHPYLSPHTHTSHHITQHTIQHTPITLTQPWFWVSILWYGAQSDTPGLIPRHRAEESQTAGRSTLLPLSSAHWGLVVVSGAVTVAGGWENHPCNVFNCATMVQLHRGAPWWHHPCNVFINWKPLLILWELGGASLKCIHQKSFHLTSYGSLLPVMSSIMWEQKESSLISCSTLPPILYWCICI